MSDIAPTLAERFYLDNGPRYVFDENLSDAEKSETKRILRNSGIRLSPKVTPESPLVSPFWGFSDSVCYNLIRGHGQMLRVEDSL